jgi:hypothetical protein
MNEDLIQKFGFSEMYEWYEIPEPQFRLGRFVTFSKKVPNRIVPVSKADQNILGVTTVNTVLDSDDPENWKYKNMCNEFGDLYLRKERLAVGQKVYDQYTEMNYIQTRKWEHFIPIPNQYFDEKKQYVKRTNRSEWIRVNLMGKCIVEDDGNCKAGEYCMPYTGKVKPRQGTAIPATEDAKQKFYVLERVSEKTIMILNK